MRSLFPYLLVALALGLFGGLAWLSRNPDASVLRQAEQWPAVGPWVERARAGMRGEATQVHGDSDVKEVWVKKAAKSVKVVDRRPPWEGPPEYVWALPGATIQAAPAPSAVVLERLTVISHLARLERRGDWFRIWRDGREAWIYLQDYDDSKPPLGEAPDPPLPLEPRPPDPERLAEARRLLGDGAVEARLGEYRLFTDLEDTALLERLDRVVRQLETVYGARYGLTPTGRPRAAVVIFEGEASFQALQAAAGLSSVSAAGHASRGVAALYLGTRSPKEMTSTLVHELTHLVNRRSIGPALPPWLDEGLCDDMANLEIDARGLFDPSKLGGRRLTSEDQITVEGAQAALDTLARAALRGTLPRLEHVLGLDWERFLSSARLHYDVSAFFVRFLLEGSRAEAFRRFLAAASRGEPITVQSLSQALEISWPVLQADFEAWLAEEARRARGQPAF